LYGGNAKFQRVSTRSSFTITETSQTRHLSLSWLAFGGTGPPSFSMVRLRPMRPAK
jgi:hypothetical protein